MRRRLPRKALCLGGILCVCLLWPVGHLLSMTTYGDPYNDHLVVCNVGDSMRSELLRAAEGTLAVLGARNVTSFLCYGSLWAYLRRGKLFPWQRRLRLCAVAEGLEAVEAEELRLDFSRRNLDLVHDRTSGAYAVRDQKYVGAVSGPGRLVPEVELVLFRRNEALRVNGEREDVYRRVGWRHRILPPGSEGLEEFPDHLIALPLRTVTFNRLKVEIPHEAAELQKYHYKEDWWTERKPNGCEKL